MTLQRLCALVLLCLASMLASSSASASEPMRIKVALHVVNLGKLDTTTGRFDVDAYAIFSCDREPCTPDNFDIANGKLGSKELQDDQPRYKVYHLNAQCVVNIDLKMFPFDRHELRIEFEDKMLDTTRLVYEVDAARTALDPEVSELGWVLDRTPHPRVVEATYASFGKTYSKYVFGVDVARPVLAGVMKGLLPAIFIMLTGFLSLLLPPGQAGQRTAIVTGTLVGSVMFHLSLTSSVPQVAYLTFADRFMLVNYLTLLLCLAATVWILRLEQQQRTAEAARIHTLTALAVPAVWLILHVVDAAL